MKTVTYASVLQRACELTGRVYSALTTEEATLLRGYLARALRWAWEHYPWPDILNYTQEYFAPTYSASATYAAGTVVYFPGTGTYYVACQSTTGNPPATHNIATDVYTIVYDQWQYAQPNYESSVGGNWISTKRKPW